MKSHVQLVHRAVSRADRAVLVKPSALQTPTASMEKVQHRPDSVSECFGLLDRDSRRGIVYMGTLTQSGACPDRLDRTINRNKPLRFAVRFRVLTLATAPKRSWPPDLRPIYYSCEKWYESSICNFRGRFV